MNTQLVIFDLAGTTIKHKQEVHQSFIDAFQKEDISISYLDANKAMGKPKPIAISEILEDMGRKNEISLADIIHENFQTGMIDYYKKSNDVEENEGASQVFAALKSEGIKVGIDTGFDRETANVLIEKMGWHDKKLIDYICTSDEVPEGRPSPDMIHKLMKEANISDASCIMKVGDTPVDLLEGFNAKCQWNVGITTGAFPEVDLIGYPHTHFIKELREILEIVEWPE